MPWTIAYFVDHGTVWSCHLMDPNGARLVIHGESRPMRGLCNVWMNSMEIGLEPKFQVIDTDDGPTIRLLTADEGK
jgi:hypothetical protein